MERLITAIYHAATTVSNVDILVLNAHPNKFPFIQVHNNFQIQTSFLRRNISRRVPVIAETQAFPVCCTRKFLLRCFSYCKIMFGVCSCTPELLQIMLLDSSARIILATHGRDTFQFRTLYSSAIFVILYLFLLLL